MWSVLRWFATRFGPINWLLKALGGFAFFLPIAFLLKVIGLPVLLVLGVLALPILFVLFLLGLPIFLVLLVGGMLMGLVGMVLTIGVAALKIGLFVVLPIWLVFKLVGWIFGRGRHEPPSSPPPSSPPPVADIPVEPDVP